MNESPFSFRCAVPPTTMTSRPVPNLEPTWTPRYEPGVAQNPLRSGEQLPLSLGDDLDSPVGHLDGRLIVDGVRRTPDLGGPPPRLGDGVLRHELVTKVREDREVDDPERAVVPVGRCPLDEVVTDPGGHHHASCTDPHPDRFGQ